MRLALYALLLLLLVACGPSPRAAAQEPEPPAPDRNAVEAGDEFADPGDEFPNPGDRGTDDEGSAEMAAAPPADPAAAWSQQAARHDQIPWTIVLQVAGAAALVLIWVAAADWVNRDSQIFELNYKKWNPIVFFPVVVAGVALAFIPMPVFVRLPLIGVALLASILPYVVVHNRSVQPHQTVLTGSWWRFFFAALLGKLGIKVATERKAEYEKGAPVELLAMGAADANQDNVNLLKARQSPGYLLLKDLIADMSERRADKVLLDYAQQGVAVRYEIDGVWHPSEARDRESGDVMLAVMKTLANLTVTERKKKQASQFAAKYQGKKYLCPIVSQGVPSGERVQVTLLTDKSRPHTYEALGMREALQQEWGEIMAADRGLVVFSALPGGGLTAMTDASLEETDRLMRDFVAIESIQHREHDIQNINVTTFDPTKGESAASVLPKLIRTYPNVYILRDFGDVDAAKLLMDQAADDRLVVTTIPARDSAEALLRLLQLKIPQKQFASVVTAVLYQRLIRKLCSDCKVGYPPPPDVLKKLGIPAGKVQQFYRPPKPEEIEKPCPTCRGIGYFGRTGVFELLKVNDAMRDILQKQPQVDLLRKAARAGHQRSLQEEGILLVARGVTSLQELMRVLKPDEKA